MTNDPIQIINQLFTFAIAAGGLLAFGEIVYGGFQYTIATGDTSRMSDARDRITQALVGVLLLFGSYLILKTINPEIVTAKLPPLGAVEPQTEAVLPPELDKCNNLKDLAAFYKVPFPAKIDPALSELITCIRNYDTVRGLNLRENATIDISHSICNYTRGAPLCDYPCSHTTLSCHYGGGSGTDGALAVDFGVGSHLVTQSEYDAVRAAVKVCGKGQAKMNPFGDLQHLNHIHVSAAKCDGDMGWIVK